MFHVKKAYKAMSSNRSALQSSFSGGGDSRSRIMAKIAPKGEVFAGKDLTEILNTVEFLVSRKKFFTYHSWPENLKKSRQKLVKSNKSK